MHLCIASEYNCTFDEFEAMVKKSLALRRHRQTVGAGRGKTSFITDYELVKINDQKSVLLVNCTDMEAMQALITTPEMKQWDEENDCVDTIHSMERIN